MEEARLLDSPDTLKALLQGFCGVLSGKAPRIDSVKAFTAPPSRKNAKMDISMENVLYSVHLPQFLAVQLELLLHGKANVHMVIDTYLGCTSIMDRPNHVNGKVWRGVLT
eukprot:6264837-Amphidinium_carterae.6